MTSMKIKLYILDYRERTIFEEFLSILFSFFISIVIDARRFPRSKIPHFSKMYREKILMHKGILLLVSDFLVGIAVTIKCKVYVFKGV